MNILKTMVAVVALGSCLTATATTDTGIIPLPKTMKVNNGSLTIGTDLTIGGTSLPDSIVAEANKFALIFNKVTGHNPKVSANNANAVIELVLDNNIANEGYNLTITSDKATITASTTAGFFYAFQTIRQMLPAEFLAVKPSINSSFTLPCVVISDTPRFSYRGFMLDEGRHFFGMEEVKRLLDLMAIYKMNNFHWHLTEDQGWRIEIKKYPRLTSVGSIAPNSWFTDMKYGGYWTNTQYGPYFYTQEQLKEIVEYAKNLHINIIPEVDMPGHFTAAMTAYPEYSCTPYGSHTVWSSGGISGDVMNVANPKAVQFAKDILKELCDIFPGKYIHIGGDECPDNAWKNNAECQALYQKEKLTNYRQLQSRFIKQMSDYLKTMGRSTVVWNEAITANGADLDSIKAAGVKVFCWNPAASSALQAAQNGLDNVVTFYGPYYINRKQSQLPGEPSGAGDGSDSLRVTYNAVPVPNGTSKALSKHYTGVQGTFWTEHVNERNYLEYLALPRLIAVAEAGWTPQASKDYAKFRQRMIADTTYLNMAGYNYCRHDLVDRKTDVVYPEKDTYYRLVTKATDNERKNTCITLLYKDSPIMTSKASSNPVVNRLWAAAQVAKSDTAYKYQMWKFEPSETDSTLFALVCEAFPNGSVKANPTAKSNTGRWDYDTKAKHYNFKLGVGGYGIDGTNRYYTINSDQTTGWYMNASMSGQGNSINLWNSPASGNGGLWTFVADETKPVVYDAFNQLIKDKYYVIGNAVEGYNGQTLADAKGATYLQWTDKGGQPDGACNIWQVVNAESNSDNTQTLQLKNLGTNRSIGTPVSNKVNDQIGFPVQLTTSNKNNVKLTYHKSTGDFTLTISDKNLFPISAKSDAWPGIVSSGTPIRPQGNAWTITEVTPLHVKCIDDKGTIIADYYTAKENSFTAPTINNFKAIKTEQNGDEVTVTYQRTAYTVRLDCLDQNGGVIKRKEITASPGQTIATANPKFEYYKLLQGFGGSATISSDTTLTATYETNALSGVKDILEPVRSIRSGASYVIYDFSPTDLNRRGYRNVDPQGKVHQTRAIADSKPGLVWKLTAEDSKYKVSNLYTGQYIPTLTKSQPVTLSDQAGLFTFTLDTNGVAWKVKGTNNLYWDGLADGMTGWTSYGHPYYLYDYLVDPYFTVTVNYLNENNASLLPATVDLVRAGEAYSLLIPQIDNATLDKTEGADNLDAIKNYTIINLHYNTSTSGISTVAASSKPNDIYNLQGMKLAKPQRGINIKHGRKIIVR